MSMHYIKKTIHYFKKFNLGYCYYKPKLKELFKWTFFSREGDNFSYDISEQSKKYLSHFLAVVLDCDEALVDKIIKEPNENSELKKQIIKKITDSGKEIMDINFHFGRRIGWYVIARIFKPRIIIETGVDKGLGSTLLCSALEKNESEGYDGKYYGTDINTQAGFLFIGSKWEKWGKILFGDSVESLKKINENVDLFINDSDHSKEYEMKEYLTIKEKLSERAIILGDNRHVSSSLEEFSLITGRSFLFFKEEPINHWYPGGGIGFSFPKKLTTHIK